MTLPILVFWLAFLFLCLLGPLGYGWGYRRWGMPYPRYIQQRRHDRYVSESVASTRDHRAWGRGGDFIWLAFVFWTIWSYVVFVRLR